MIRNGSNLYPYGPPRTLEQLRVKLINDRDNVLKACERIQLDMAIDFLDEAISAPGRRPC